MRLPKYSQTLLEKMDRPQTNLDFIALNRDADSLIRVLRGLGYSMGRAKEYLMTISGRCILEHPETKLYVDIFSGKLAFCHATDLTRRISVDKFRISLAGLLLEKTQLVKITRKTFRTR
jgi:hypothetical protein